MGIVFKYTKRNTTWRTKEDSNTKDPNVEKWRSLRELIKKKQSLLLEKEKGKKIERKMSKKKYNIQVPKIWPKEDNYVFF